MIAAPTPPDGEHAICARALVRTFGELPALDRIDLTVRRGSWLLLLGPNGAGKSTLLRVLATLLRPTSGTLRLFGEEATRSDRRSLRRRVGLLSHQTYLYETLTAEENLSFYARLYDLPRPEVSVRASLASAGLSDRAPDLVRTFSRGMKQRLAIARALLHDPDLLLLDEPFSGLDRASTTGLRDRLLEARAAGRTCVLATHDVASAAGLADRVIVIDAGRTVEDRPAAALTGKDLEDLLAGAVREAGTRGPA